ncbi:hypothetical protein MXB_5177, partial [Myxobolus squamalis]
MTSELSHILCDFHEECETLIQVQIKEQLKASYAFTNMVSAPEHYLFPMSLTALASIEMALEIEKSIYHSLQKIHMKALHFIDAVLSKMLEDMLIVK